LCSEKGKVHRPRAQPSKNKKNRVNNPMLFRGLTAGVGEELASELLDDDSTTGLIALVWI